MAGVRIGLGSVRGGLTEWAAQLRLASSQLEPTVAAIAKEELDTAVTVIKRLSPVKTGLFRRSWKVEQRTRLTFAIVDTAPYAEWVHKRGERGSPFWTTYALPEVEAANARIKVRVRDTLRDMLRARAVTKIAPSLPVVRSLAARGRLR